MHPLSVLRAREPSLLYDSDRSQGRPRVAVYTLRAVIANTRNSLGLHTGEWRRNLGRATRALVCGDWQHALSCVECTAHSIRGHAGLAYERGTLVACANLLRRRILADRGVALPYPAHEPTLVD